MRKKLLRVLRMAPVALLFCAGVASAQVTGQIVGQVTDAASGKPVAGALIIATSPALQGESTAVSDSKGEYILTTLPPGKYKLLAQLTGYKPFERTDITLRVGYTLRANMSVVPESVQLEEQVVRTGVAPVVNIGTAETGTVVSKEFLATIPGTRTFEQVATIAPTAQTDFYGVSFAGGSSPENNYIIDGLRVSNPSHGTLGTNLLTNFVDQIDVKVGSFMPEFGYSSSGILNTVTKSGSNEFHGSIWGNLTPGFFTPALPATGINGMAIGTQSTPYKGAYQSDFGIELGGPIVKDKLWFYAGFAPQYNYSTFTSYYRYLSNPCSDVTNPLCRNPGYGTQRYLQDSTSQFLTTPFGDNTTWGTGFNRYFAIAKLTWLVNENHNVFVSFNTQPTTTYGRGTFYASPAAASIDNSSNNLNATLNYTGKFLDKHLLLEVKGGWYYSNFKENAATVAGVDRLNTNLINWITVQPMSTFLPDVPCGGPAGSCLLSAYFTGGAGFIDNPTNNRFSGSAALTGLFSLLGQHQLKGGVQIDYATYDDTRYYSGGGSFNARGAWGNNPTGGAGTNSFQISRGYGNIVYDPVSGLGTQICSAFGGADGTTCINPGIANSNQPGTLTQNTATWSNGYFLQDSWTIANVLTLNFGVRLDTQTLNNTTPTTPGTETAHPATDALGVPQPSVNINDEWAPRVQAIWDFTGNGRGKIQGNWGMYYEAIPLDLALRSLGIEASFQGGYQMSSCAGQVAGATIGQSSTYNPFKSCDTFGLAPGQGSRPNVTDLSGVPDAAGVEGYYPYNPYYTAVAPDLKGSYTTQFGGGIQYEVLQDLSVGVDYIGRRLGRVIEDLSSNDGAAFMVANPSEGQAYAPSANAGYVSPTYAIGADNQTGTSYFVKWPKPVRDYDAVSFTLNKNFSKNWLMQASYTWSSLRGNYAGLFRTEDSQLDPNITADFDLVALLGNKTGPLGGNREHYIKLAASYMAVLSPSVSLVPSANVNVFSGYPVSALARHPLYGLGQSYVLPRGFVGDLPWTWKFDVGLKAIWALSGPYTLQFSLDIFNLFNANTTQWVDQNYSRDSRIVPMQNSQCSSKNAISSKTPISALQSDCPDLIYARTTDNQAPVINLNFGQPIAAAQGVLGAYQVPISARFGVQLTF